ncbi:MAG: right-handed parallel beta-helix repeat-containing protein [Candidatus Heimdallarchaeaceae archaeon]|jgi:parallel beta-helix repeat protein
MLILSFLIIYSVTSNSSVSNTLAKTSSNPLSDQVLLQDLVDHTPMTVDVDGDFVFHGFPGNGDPSNPYRIENYNITTTGQPCLSFAGYTTKHFVVQNCFLKTNTYDAILLGKYQEMAAGTVHIFNNTIISRNHTALTLNGSIGGVIDDNLIIGLDGGIVIKDDFTYVSGNTINAHTAIKITNSIGVEIIDNICDKNSNVGIEVINSSEVIITGNTGSIILNGSLDARLEENYMVDFDGGIEIRDSDFTYVKGNTVQANTAIQLTGSNSVKLINNICNDNAEVGIKLTNSNYTVITGNNCSNNGDSGIRSENSLNLTISYNYLKENFYGMRIIGSSDSLITNNYFGTNTGYGLSMQGSVGLNQIYHNAFFDNNFAGNKIQASDDVGDQWYSVELQEGNYWNTWNPAVSASYTIDGAAGSEDLYPLDEVPDISEFSKSYAIFIMIFMFFAIPLVLLSKRRK